VNSCCWESPANCTSRQSDHPLPTFHSDTGRRDLQRALHRLLSLHIREIVRLLHGTSLNAGDSGGTDFGEHWPVIVKLHGSAMRKLCPRRLSFGPIGAPFSARTSRKLWVDPVDGMAARVLSRSDEANNIDSSSTLYIGSVALAFLSTAPESAAYHRSDAPFQLLSPSLRL